MILADESVDKIVVDELISKGIQVYSIYELNRGLTDEEVIELARLPPRVILTEDKNFGEWVFAHDVRDISVILIRYDYINVHAIASIVSEFVTEKRESLFGKFSTVTLDKIRIRTIK